MTEYRLTSIGKQHQNVATNVVHGRLRTGDVGPVRKKRLMPMYEYRCPICNTQMELELSMDHDLVRCTDCGAQANRIYSVPGLIFKGTGWGKDK